MQAQAARGHELRGAHVFVTAYMTARDRELRVRGAHVIAIALRQGLADTEDHFEALCERRLHLLLDGLRLCLWGPLRLHLGLLLCLGRRLGSTLALAFGSALGIAILRTLPLSGVADCPLRVHFLRRLLGGREPGVREFLRGVATIKKASRGTRIYVFSFGTNVCACKRSPMGENIVEAILFSSLIAKEEMPTNRIRD